MEMEHGRLRSHGHTADMEYLLVVDGFSGYGNWIFGGNWSCTPVTDYSTTTFNVTGVVYGTCVLFY